jgi:hypothetical protein
VHLKRRAKMEDIKEQIQLLEAKIAQVNLDVAKFREQGHADKRVETMEFYREYLEDELKMLRQKNES